MRPKKTLGDEKSSPAPEADPPAEPPAAPPKPVAAGTRPSSSEHSRRLSRGQKPEPLQAPPQTPPAEESSPAPLIIHTPPTPTDSQPPSAAAAGSIQRPANAALAASNMITQRRRTSSNAGPSKSSAPAAPLTPTPENAPAAPGNPASTFFSSMFSAVQNTASSLSTTIPALGQGPGKGRNAPAREQPEDEHPDAVVEVEPSAISRPSTEPKEPAVKTLGMGDLSLSHLGIVDAPSPAPSPVKARVGGETETRARSESAPADPNAVVAGLAAEGAQVSRAVSLHEGDEKAPPPTGGLYEAKTDVRRSGSIRSAIGQRRNRDRGGSVATHATTGTGGTVGAAIAAANSSVAHPGAPASGPKLTGFAVANKKRNRDFHALFKSVPDDDYLIEDYSCALQREILAHGRLYISEGHLCFSSNILGWVTTLVMSFDEIVSVEKRSTALVFKNGLEISTLHAKHIFASFASRDTTYDLIVKIWKLGHPHLQSTLNGVRLEEPGGDRTERIETESASAAGTHSASASDDESGGGGGGGDGDGDDDDDDDEDVYDEDEDDAEGPDAGQSSDGPAAAADAAEKTATRKASGALAPPEKRSDDGAPAGGGADFPGPAAHAPTDCGDAATHYDKVVADDVIAAPLGKVFTLLFGAASAAWMGRWLSADQKCTDIQMEDRRGLSDEVRSRTYSYIKPLSASIGPKQTKCIVTEQLEHLDFEKAVNINISTQNPDVPNGNIFVVKTKYCLTWAENNATRVQVNCTIEWSGKSWLKGMFFFSFLFFSFLFPLPQEDILLTSFQVPSSAAQTRARRSTARTSSPASRRPSRRGRARGRPPTARRAPGSGRAGTGRRSRRTRPATARARRPRRPSRTGASSSRRAPCSGPWSTRSGRSSRATWCTACWSACWWRRGSASASGRARRGTRTTRPTPTTRTAWRPTTRCGGARRASCGTGSRSASASSGWARTRRLGSAARTRARSRRSCARTTWTSARSGRPSGSPRSIWRCSRRWWTGGEKAAGDTHTHTHTHTRSTQSKHAEKKTKKKHDRLVPLSSLYV